MDSYARMSLKAYTLGILSPGTGEEMGDAWRRRGNDQKDTGKEVVQRETGCHLSLVDEFNSTKKEETTMKKFLTIGVLVVLILSAAAAAFAAADKEAIKKQVDEIVASINSGKSAEDFKDAAKREPYYVFIMKQNGDLLVHPSLTGQNLKEKAEPVYNAVSKATPEGTWVNYEWQGKMKHTYVRTTSNGLIVGSGYSE